MKNKFQVYPMGDEVVKLEINNSGIYNQRVDTYDSFQALYQAFYRYGII